MRFRVVAVFDEARSGQWTSVPVRHSVCPMRRLSLVFLLLAATVSAQKRPPTPAQAKAANKTAFARALGKLKLKPIKLATVPADPEETTDEAHFVGNVVFDKNGHHDPTFVVGPSKDVYRVVRKITTIGRVKQRVCHAGPVLPVRVKRTRFDVPPGHTFAGDVEVSFDAYVLDEINTCR